MLYQALIGAWPLRRSIEHFVERIQAYAIKAAREGKEHTSWINVSESYEKALTRFVEDILDPDKCGRFLEAFATFVSRPTLVGVLNSLSQLTLKATIPGVVDFYQGTEFWDLSLVDPDNRRPIDFNARADFLRRTYDWQNLAATWQTGQGKIDLTRRLLALRNARSDVFLRGSFQALEVAGRDSDHVVAFARKHRSDCIVVAIGRHFSKLTGGGRHWPRNWEGRIVFDGRNFSDELGNIGKQVTLDLNTLFSRLPVSVLGVGA